MNYGNVATNPHRSQTREWPTLLLPLKAFAQNGDHGAGDIIERSIGPLGGNAFKTWFETTFNRKCNCNTRKQNWNRKYPL